jgi:phage shock protein A
MGFFDRVTRVVRANVNSWTASAASPEQILEATVMEMQDNLIQMRQGVASAIATQKRTERQAANAQSNASEWFRRAQLALQQDNEPLAREALVKRKTHQDTASALLSQIEQQNAIVGKLKKDMRSLEIKIAEVKTKKDMYIARARSAQASLRLQELMGDINGATSTGVFERVEDKILRLESQIEVISITSKDGLEEKFSAMESGNTIDSQLSAMKIELSNGNNERI